MFHILGFLFIIIIAILLIGLSIIGTVVRSIFGLGGRRTSSSSGGYAYNKNEQTSHSSSNEAEPEEGELRPRHKKLFSKDEGEYVDFEEVKD
jgi:mannose/fructose/N-acetylgalactosamine-specific phosphotransferase system component IIC